MYENQGRTYHQPRSPRLLSHPSTGYPSHKPYPRSQLPRLHSPQLLRTNQHQPDRHESDPKVARDKLEEVSPLFLYYPPTGLPRGDLTRVHVALERRWRRPGHIVGEMLGWRPTMCVFVCSRRRGCTVHESPVSERFTKRLLELTTQTWVNHPALPFASRKKQQCVPHPPDMARRCRTVHRSSARRYVVAGPPAGRPPL